MTLLKCLSFSDTHGYLRDEDAYDQMIDKDGDADLVFIPGDIFNGEELSPWPGPYPSARLVDEINLVGLQFKHLLEDLKPSARVFVGSGNHGKGRHSRAIQKNPGGHQVTQQDLLSMVCQGYEIKYLPCENGGHAWQPEKTYDFGDRIKYHSGALSWVLAVGENCLIVHKETYYKLTDTMFRILFLEWAKTNYPGVELLIQAHTHRRCDIQRGPFRYIEQGCMCHPGDYTISARPSYAPMQKGYTTFLYDTETKRVDVDSAQLHSLGSETLFKPVQVV